MEKIFPPNKTTPVSQEARQERAVEDCGANAPRDESNAPAAEYLGKYTWGGLFSKRNKGKANGSRHRS